MSGIVKHFLNSHGSLRVYVGPSSELQNDATRQQYIFSGNAGLTILLIVAVGVITYLPTINNSFISDDFTLLSMLKVLDQYPSYIIEATSEFFRSVTYVYFWTCFKLFGAKPELFYWSSIGLHAVISVLVYLLVRIVTRQTVAAMAAAVFFASYERHQEAVMWISAANEIILTLNCILFLILWECALSHARFRRTNFTLAFIVLALALFSKEAAVALVPLTMFGMILRGYNISEAFRKSLPLWAMAGMYVVLWLSQADRNFFVTQGHYALGLHFFPVYARSIGRMLSATLPFLLAFLVIRHRNSPQNRTSGTVPSDARSLLFFAALLVLATVPYCFLTYLDHIPSRNTYFPSVGLAGINGVLFAALYGGLSSVQSKRLAVLFLSVMISANAGYIWLKKDPQYVERAAPTRELLETLNKPGLRKNSQLPIEVCGFPLHPWIGSEAVAGFTHFDSKEVVFAESCERSGGGTALGWDQDSGTYVKLR